MSNVVGSGPSRALPAEAPEARDVDAMRVGDQVQTPSQLTS